MSKVRLLVIVSLIVACALIAACAAIAAACGDSSPAATASGLQMVGNDPALPTVAVVTTGGTIAEKIDPQTGGAVPSVSGADLVAAVPGLTKLANIAVLSFCNIDSSQMTPQIWANLSRKVAEILKMPEIRGVVVTHGTDTMEEGAYFLDLTLSTDKPVVFTGAMNNASSPFPDGPGNLYNAVVQVCAENTQDWGVTVTLNSYVHPAREVRKTQTTNVQAFTSGEKGYLGYIFGDEVQRIDSRTNGPRLPLPEKLPKVVYLATYAGDDGALVRYAVDSGAQGLVIDAVGAGNVNAAVNEAVKLALSKKIPVVIASRVHDGAVEPIYGGPGGSMTLLDEGCILAGDLMGGKARLLLMLGIAEHGNDVNELKKLFR